MTKTNLSPLKLWISAAIIGTLIAVAVFVAQAHLTGSIVSDGGPLPLCDPRRTDCHMPGRVVELPTIADGSDPMPLCRRNCGPKQCTPGNSCALRSDTDVDKMKLSAYKPKAHLLLAQGSTTPRGCRWVYTCHHYTPDGTAYCQWELYCGV